MSRLSASRREDHRAGHDGSTRAAAPQAESSDSRNFDRGDCLFDNPQRIFSNADFVLLLLASHFELKIRPLT